MPPNPSLPLIFKPAPPAGITELRRITGQVTTTTHFLLLFITANTACCVYIVDNDTYDFKEIYTLADKALYRAKNAGRNQVVYQ